jgi:hypothetical protein
MKQLKKGFLAKKRVYFLCGNALKELLEQYPQHFIQNTDLDEFIEESLSFKDDLDGEKNLSPERGVKILGLLGYIFDTAHTNNIPIDKNLESFYDGLFSSLSHKKLFGIFSDAYKQTYALLQSLPNREFLDTKIYFLDDEALQKLVKLRNKLNSSFEVPSDNRRYSYSKIANIINENFVAKNYTIKLIAKFPQIIRPKSVQYYLPAHYEITKNKKIKAFKEMLDTHNFHPQKVKYLVKEHEAELKRDEEEHRYIMQELSKGDDSLIDVKIIGYEHSSYYPELRATLENGRSKYAYIKKSVPNLLWYDPNLSLNNMDVVDILKHYNHGYGDVYYIEKERSEISPQ